MRDIGLGTVYILWVGSSKRKRVANIEFVYLPDSLFYSSHSVWVYIGTFEQFYHWFIKRPSGMSCERHYRLCKELNTWACLIFTFLRSCAVTFAKDDALCLFTSYSESFLPAFLSDLITFLTLSWEKLYCSTCYLVKFHCNLLYCQNDLAEQLVFTFRVNVTGCAPSFSCPL